MEARKIGIEEDIKRDKQLELKKKLEKKQFTRNAIKEQLLKLLSELYDDGVDKIKEGKSANEKSSLSGNKDGGYVFQRN